MADLMTPPPGAPILKVINGHPPQDASHCETVLKNCRDARAFFREAVPLIPTMTDDQLHDLRRTVGQIQNFAWACEISIDAEIAKRPAAKPGPKKPEDRDIKAQGITAGIAARAEQTERSPKTVEKNIQVHKTFFGTPEDTEMSLDIAERLDKSFFVEAVRALRPRRMIRMMDRRRQEAKAIGKRYSCADARNDVDSILKRVRRKARCLEARKHGPVEGVQCGDCRTIAAGWPDRSIKMLLIDPPYGVACRGGAVKGLAHDPIVGDKDISVALPLLQEGLQSVSAAMCGECHVICFCASKHEEAFCKALEEAGYDVRERCVWYKMGFSQGDTGSFSPDHERFIHATRGGIAIQPRLSNVLICPRIPGNSDQRKHLCQKPLALLRELIKACTIPGEVVADLFAGVGSTLVAAKSLGRSFLGSEIDPEYYNIILTRLQDAQAEVDKEARMGVNLVKVTAPSLQSEDEGVPAVDIEAGKD